MPRALIIGGLSFGIIPICLSTLGFIAVTLSRQSGLEVSNPEMVGPIVVGTLLPKVALFGFVLMAFAGLCSTIDSALCAVSSIGAIDIHQKYVAPSGKDKEVLRAARIIMILAAVIGGRLKQA